jgi:hypothetical protein
VDSNNVTPGNGLESFEVLAKRDQALFHAGLAIAAVYYDTGSSDIYHSQQTLKVVSRRLGHYHMQTSDETIGAVGLLVIHDVCLHAQSQDMILVLILPSFGTDTGRHRRAFRITYEWFTTDGGCSRGSSLSPNSTKKDVKHVCLPAYHKSDDDSIK